ncbi:MAG: hypothetical protein Q8807_03870, partial ['Waltheria sp.' little leaf phytoplasma]|nr:hypothetical protein ['Waltheria sp.' little leaf phytoplasma]
MLQIALYCFINYYVSLEGIDALVFTAGVGENSIFFRSE